MSRLATNSPSLWSPTLSLSHSHRISYEGYTQTTQCAQGAPSTDFLDNGNGLWMELYDLDSFVLTDTPSGSAPLYEDTPLPEAAPQYLDTDGPTIHVSDTFHPHANLDATPPNIVLVSSDEIFFLVHYHKLMSASYNAFAGLFFPGSHITGEALTLILPDSSDTLNVVLHCIYNISCDNYHPTFECLSASLSAFEKYGLALPHYLACGTPLYSTILTFAPVRPIETYALAASYALEDLAVAASSYTLHIKVHNIPQNLADQMGPQYLQRLHHLHASRTSRLKALLDEMPYPHVEKPHCSVGQRQVLSRAYHLAGSQVLYDATPAISSSGIEMTMRGLIEAVSCPDCKNALTAHVVETVKKWMLFKSTI